MRSFPKWFVAIATSMGLTVTQAYAALPTTVQTAIDGAQADGETLGYALLVMAITVGLVFYLKGKAGR
jgi:hypothetical protein